MILRRFWALLTGKPDRSAAMSQMTTDQIARMAHETMRAYAQTIGEAPMPAWEEAPDWMVTSTKAAVEFRLANPHAPASAQHDQWMAERLGQGWRYGKVKDAQAKTHPSLVSYRRLSVAERRKAG
jgi:RyR domain.